MHQTQIYLKRRGESKEGTRYFCAGHRVPCYKGDMCFPGHGPWGSHTAILFLSFHPFRQSLAHPPELGGNVVGVEDDLNDGWVF